MKHIKRCAALLACREMQMKTTRRHSTSISKAKIKHSDTAKCCGGRRLRGLLTHASGNAERCSHSRQRTVWQFLVKQTNALPHKSATAALGICPRKVRTYSHKNLYTHIHSSFIRNSLKLATTQKPFNGWWLNRQWCNPNGDTAQQ